ncbi:hypothetical protein T11_7576 [Trichinella zimbabwensis]|uniref:Uncharacterized protein n=1 Tax=Trichinella zimbabwensis TaxID=268475 RepID=A0A0V1HKD1_9BILA|nr:hypothetical protein T11_7576 [Trichinella zimbabwensis]
MKLSGQKRPIIPEGHVIVLSTRSNIGLRKTSTVWCTYGTLKFIPHWYQQLWSANSLLMSRILNNK